MVPKDQTQQAFDPVRFLAGAGIGRRIVQFKKNGILFSQGAPADSVFYLQKGRAKLSFLSREGKEVTIGVVSSPSFIGEEAAAKVEGLRRASATALTECISLKIDRLAIIRVLREESSFSDLFVSFLLARNARTQSELTSQLSNSCEKRLARALLMMAQLEQAGCAEAPIPQVTQQDLADMIGTTRSRVGYFLGEFQKHGFIERRGAIRVHESLKKVLTTLRVLDRAS